MIVTAVVLYAVVGALLGTFYGLLSTVDVLQSRYLTVRTLLAGSLIWVVTYQLFARIGAPALLQLPQLRLWVICTLFFGLPLTSALAGQDRRRQLARTVSP